MLHLGLRVTNLERSLAFYTAVGYAKIGSVPETTFGSLTMLQLPDDPFVSLELVHDPARPVEDIPNGMVVTPDGSCQCPADDRPAGSRPGTAMGMSWRRVGRAYGGRPGRGEAREPRAGRGRPVCPVGYGRLALPGRSPPAHGGLKSSRRAYRSRRGSAH